MPAGEARRARAAATSDRLYDLRDSSPGAALVDADASLPRMPERPHS
jgi:hypothetical protein